MSRDRIASSTVLIVPGLRDHVPEHWQTLLERKLPKAMTVPRMQDDKLSCAAWVGMLDRSLAQIDGPVILAAHSAGVMIVVHWARGHRRAIKGALLAAPPDFESPLPDGYPTQDVLQQNGWLPTPRARLPFPSIVAASRNDPLGRIERVAALAAAWGQPPGRYRRGRPPQSGVGLRRVADGGRADRRTDAMSPTSVSAICGVRRKDINQSWPGAQLLGMAATTLPATPRRARRSNRRDGAAPAACRRDRKRSTISTVAAR